MRLSAVKNTTFIICLLIIANGFTLGSIARVPDPPRQTSNTGFYFIQLTDTHVMNKLFDHNRSASGLRTVLTHVCSFDPKPAFIVITGDLTNWGGSWISGAMNCLAFASCFYKKDGQLYADADHSIPVYTTPGNHEYIYTHSLRNYHRYIETDDRYVVNHDEASLFFLNSGSAFFNGGTGLTNDDIAWLQDRLQNSSATIKIVLMHHPAVYFRDDNGKMYDVIYRNRETFVQSCEDNGVELVLCGHTHESRVFDASEQTYDTNISFNCSVYPPLFVQTDDCDQCGHYRNVTVSGNDVWLEPCVEVDIS
jgi:3',5'-cyclic AMP phosphodiesterase CpdA